MILQPYVIRFPAAGLVDSAAYEGFPVQASLDLSNVMPYDRFSSDSLTPPQPTLYQTGGKLRGGLRPGSKFVGAYAAALGTGGNSAWEVLYQGTDINGKICAVAVDGQGFVFTGTDLQTMANTGLGGYTKACVCDIFGVAYIVSPAKTTIATIELATGTAGTLAADVVGFDPPANGNACCNFRSRLVVAVGNQIFMSRAGAPGDWDISTTDSESAVDLNASIGAGKIGSKVLTVCSVGRNTLFVGCGSQCFAIEGDPADGGNLVTLSSNVGIVSRQAYCLDPASVLHFVGTMGFYRFAHGGDIEDLSSKLCPNFFHKLSDNILDTETLALAWDVSRRGCWGFYGANSFFFDGRNEKFFPMNFASTKGAFSWGPNPALNVTSYNKNGIHYSGDTRGLIARLDDTYNLDTRLTSGSSSTQDIDWYFNIGPLSPPLPEQLMTANNTASLLHTIEIIAGESITGYAYTVTVIASSTGFGSTNGVNFGSTTPPQRRYTVDFTSGNFQKIIRRIIGTRFDIKFSNNVSQTAKYFAMEMMVLNFTTAGMRRGW